MEVSQHDWRSDAWLATALAVALAMALIVGWSLWQMPVPIADMLDEILKVETTPLGEFAASYFAAPRWFFRPLEFANRYLAQAIVDGSPIGYNLFAIGVETLILIGFVVLLRPRRAAAFGACCIGLGYLVGHHAFAAGLELNIAISNLFIALITLGVLLWIERGWGGSVAAVLLSVLAVATKEIGLVVPVMVLTAHLVGLRRLHPLALVLLIGGATAYVGQRAWIVLGGLGTTEYGSAEPQSLLQFVLNALATGLNILTGYPMDGDFSGTAAKIAAPDKTLWFSVRIAAAILPILAIVLGALAPARSDEFPRLRYYRLLLVALAGVLATAALGFFYQRDRHGLVVLPLLAYLLSLASLRLTAARGRTLRLAATVCLVFATTAGSLRVAGLVDAQRDLAVTQKRVWVAAEPELRATYGGSELAWSIVQRYADFAASRRLAGTMRDPAWVQRWLGGSNSINR